MIKYKKNLLIYAHYYIPDTASTGQIVRELAEGMLDKFNITVICVVPSYLGTVDDKYKKKKCFREEINGVNVLRVRVPEFSKTNKVSRIKNILAEVPEKLKSLVPYLHPFLCFNWLGVVCRQRARCRTFLAVSKNV